MSGNLAKIKQYLMDLNIDIIDEDIQEELVVVKDLENGINNLVIDCEEPILILEQLIMEIKEDSTAFYKRLLQMNRELVHGAFALDEEGKRLFFRDTLQLENLDLNELEGTLQSLSLAMAEFGAELLKFAKK
ncbi:MAG: YbjN domain-containing protein [Calditrichia bacterium]|nr:YbjN domain-containing protein [Calditrichia bacterium]